MRYFNQNTFHTIVLLAGLLGLLALIGQILAGPGGALWSLLTGVFIFLVIPNISPNIVLHLYGARLLPYSQAQNLYTILNQLSAQCQMEYIPEIYYIPSQILTAFSVGRSRNTVIALSDGLLRRLNEREVIAVLAHELSHIVNKDIWVMSLADVITRFTRLLALMGYILLLINIPLIMFNNEPIPWLLLLILIIAPNISAIFQLALSRTREFNADSEAVKLTGDPVGLISALEKIERYQGIWVEQVLFPGRRIPLPPLLRTHPTTKARVLRIKQLAVEMIATPDRIDYPYPKKRPRGRFRGSQH